MKKRLQNDLTVLYSSDEDQLLPGRKILSLLTMAKTLAFVADEQTLAATLHRQLPLFFPVTDYVLYKVDENGMSGLLASSTRQVPSFITTGMIRDAILLQKEGILSTQKKGNNLIKTMALYADGRIHGVFIIYGALSIVAGIADDVLQYIMELMSAAYSHIIRHSSSAKQAAEIKESREQLAQQQYLQKAKSGTEYEELIGTSKPMQHVLAMLEQIAHSDSSVLILGETGTGKELIANAIHRSSPRRHQPMVRINCAALPANLTESELFGHERGSFTGAYDKRVGKFESAHGGTLFLDEVGELPLELQAKLLRALQEKEIERLGSNKVIKADVRVIAATNRQLLQEVAANRFRSDLYYRLNVIPLVLPPLRERKEDIPILARHFMGRIAAKLERKPPVLASAALKEMMAYHWPGNVRELEHVVERSMLLAPGNTLRDLYLSRSVQMADRSTVKPALKTLKEAERDHILAALNACNHKVYGPGGAAGILGIPVSTLNSKMKKLGIYKEGIFKVRDMG